jgi:hypothetical protein
MKIDVGFVFAMLIVMSFASCKMVKYLARYLEMKIDVHMKFCSILSQQLVSMKMVFRFVMYVVY